MLYWTDVNRYQAAKGGIFCSVQARLNKPIEKETKVLAGLQKLLSVKGNMKGRMSCLCAVLGITFLWTNCCQEKERRVVERKEMEEV